MRFGVVFAELIVGLSQIRVGQDLIRLAYGLKFLMGGGVVGVLVCGAKRGLAGVVSEGSTRQQQQALRALAHAWMVDHGHLAIGLLDLQVRRRRLHAERIVV